MRPSKRLVMILLLMPALAVASAFVGTVESNIAPSPEDGDSGNSAQVQSLEDQLQMNGGQGGKVGQMYQTKPQPGSSSPTGATLTTKASISSDGQSYCPHRRGYNTPSVSPYKPNGYAQCVYQALAQ
ncbi:MAG: hypothetical protein P1U40_01160 [Coxiellaceae bacterium]|nr:hypothetical protein [Coxiellaceae bacterium]